MNYENIKNKVFDEPQIFKFECIVTYKGEYCDYTYPEYIIKSYSYDECFEKIQDEIHNDYMDNYDTEMYYDSDWEVLEYKIDNSLNELDLNFDLTNKLESLDLK